MTLEEKGLKDGYYTGINFDSIERVKEVFYSGDLLLSKQSDISQKQFEALALEFIQNPRDNFFKSIDDAIEKVIGEINCHRVGQGFGKDEFHISYMFPKEGFYGFMNKLKNLFDYLELSDIAFFYDNPYEDEENEKYRFVRFSEYEKVED